MIALFAHDALITPNFGVSAYLPGEDRYALVINYGNHEEVLYQEILAPGGLYVFRPRRIGSIWSILALPTE